MEAAARPMAPVTGKYAFLTGPAKDNNRNAGVSCRSRRRCVFAPFRPFTRRRESIAKRTDYSSRPVSLLTSTPDQPSPPFSILPLPSRFVSSICPGAKALQSHLLNV